MHIFVSGFSENFGACDLFSEQETWFAGSDEIGKLWSEVSFIVTAFLATGYREWLAGGRSGPKRDINRHPSKAKRICPAANPSEEMTLREAIYIVGLNFENGPAVDLAGWDVALLHQLSEPDTCPLVEVVKVNRMFDSIVKRHAATNDSIHAAISDSFQAETL